MAKEPNNLVALKRQSFRLQAKTSNAQPFRFLDLPPELRVIVYEFFFEGNVVRKSHHYRTNEFNRQPALLSVNKEVHYEATLVFYQSTTFHITFGPPTLVRWLSKMPAQYCHAIKCIKSLSSTRTFGAAAQSIGQFRKHVEEAGIELNDGALWVLVRTGYDWYGYVPIWVNDLDQRVRAER